MELLQHLMGDTTFWVAVSSVLCFAVVYRKAKAPLLESLDRRTMLIHSRLNEAETLFQEAEALLADYRARQQNAETEAQAIVQAAQRRADTIIAQAQQDVEKAIAHQENAARLRIQRAEQEVVASIREAVVKAALSRVQAQLENQGPDAAQLDKSLSAVSKILH